MCKKLIYLLSFIVVLGLITDAQAASKTISLKPVVEVVIGNDGIVSPTKSNYKTNDMQILNSSNAHRVTLVSYDISGLRDLDQGFSNMSLSNLGFKSGTVDVYGVVEDEDNIDTSISWRTAPGVVNILGIHHPVQLDMEDLSPILLSFKAPANDVRDSSGTSDALNDFLNRDQDGIVTFLLAPAKEGTNVMMRKSSYPHGDGGMILNGEILTYIWTTTDLDSFDDPHDYIVDGVEGTTWDGLISTFADPNATVAINADDGSRNDLYIESSLTSWDPGPGPMLYMNLTGDFIVTVRVDDFAGDANGPVYHNSAGITARDPASDGGDENWVSMDYFPTWTAFVARSTTDGRRRELGQTDGSWTGADTFGIAEQYPYIQLERDGDNFYPRVSADGVNFLPLTDPAYQGIYDGTQTPLVINRPDLPDTLQVGLSQTTFSDSVGFVAFDDFSVQTQQIPIDPGTGNVVAGYAMENDANDSSGNAYDGVLTGDPEFVEGIDGMALALDGVDDLVELPIGPLISTLEDCTISTWVQWNGGGSWQRVIDFGNDTTVHMFLTINRGGNRPRFVITLDSFNDEDQVNTSVRINDTGWHHFAVTIDPANTTYQMLLDGNLIGQKNNARYTPSSLGETTQNYIGDAQYGADPLFDGTVDELNIYNRVLSNDEILYLAGVIEPVDPGTDNLVAYYPLDGDALDYSGNALDGTLVGIADPNDPNDLGPVFVLGMKGMGLQLDGVDDYVDCGNDPLFDFTEQITLATWVNVNDFGNGQNDPWISKGDNAWCIKGHRTGEAIEFFVFEGGWNWISAEVGPINNEWHHAVGTFDGTQLKIYLDGVLLSTKDYVGGIATAEHNVAIGTNTQASGRFSEGIHDEVRIYNRALTLEEILYIAR